MAAGRIVISQYMPARDRNGRLVSGCRMRVFNNETTTNAAIFSDSGLTTPMANPVLANASGQFPSVWADGGTDEDPILYTVAFSAADGSNIGNPSTFDDVRPSVTLGLIDADEKADINLGNATIYNPASPTIVRTVRDKMADYATAFDEIPTSLHNAITARTSTTDVSGYLQSALEKYKNLRLNDGLFICRSGITIPDDFSNIVGSRAGTELRVTGDGGFILIDADGVSDFNLRGVNISCYDGATADGTTAIRFKNSHTIGAYDFRIRGTFATQIALESGVFQYGYFLDDYSLEANCIEAITVGKTGGVVQETYLGTGMIVGGSVSGVGLYDASGFYDASLSILGGHRALVVNPGVGQVVRYVRGCDFVCDSTSGAEAVLITTSGGTVETWNSNIWGASSYTEAGILIDEGSGTIRNLKLGGTTVNNYKAGLVVTKATGIRAEGIQSGLNSRSGSADFPNITIGAGAVDTYVSGKAVDVGSNTFTELANYAVVIEDGATGTHLDNLETVGCVTGTVLDAGSETLITNCPGVELLSEGTRGVAGRETYQGLNKTVFDFQPNPLPGADNTAALQAMIDYAVAFGAFGVTVRVPYGDWYSNTLTIDGRCNIDFGTARLIKLGTTGDLLRIEGTEADPIFGVRITGKVGLSQAVTGATAGRMIYMEYANACFIEAVVTPFPHAPWQGVEMFRCTSTRVDVEITACLSDGFKAVDCVDITLSEGTRSDGNGGRGFAFDACSGVYVPAASAYSNDGLDWDFDETVTPTVATPGMSFLFLTNTIADTGGTSTFRLCKVKSSVLTGCWGSSQSVTTADCHGFIIDQCTVVDLIGCKAINNNACGAFVTGGSVGIHFVGGEYNDNGKVTGSTYRAGIAVGSDCEVRFTGVNARDMRSSGKTQQYGIQGIGTPALLSVGGACDLRGNAVGPMVLAFAPTLFQQDGTNLTGEATTVASATTINVGYFNTSIEVSGTADIYDITPKWTGREITFLPTGSCRFIDTANAGAFLSPSGPLTPKADGALVGKVKSGGQIRPLSIVTMP